MPIERYTIMQDFLPYARDVVMLSHERNWTHSPKVNGILQLRSNPYKKTSWTTHNFSTNGSDSLVKPPIGGSPEGRAAKEQAFNQARARFRGQLYKDSASLGVTFAQGRQAIDMIAGKFNLVGSQMDDLIKLANRHMTAGGPKNAKTLAGQFLEFQFGWKPLVSDILNAARQYVSSFPESGAVAASGQSDWTDQMYDQTIMPYQYSTEKDMTGNVVTTVSARYRVTNPNLWMAERLGLINVGAVAWDLVPWSFVVNMFSTTGALVNNLSDFSGLTFDNESTTERLEESIVLTKRRNDGGSTSSVSGTRFEMSRTVGAIARPYLLTRIPEANPELAAIAASLVIQKLPVLNKAQRWVREMRSLLPRS